MTRPIVIIAAAWFVLLPATAVAQGAKKNPPAKKNTSQPADRKLTLDQIRKLISIQTPDAVVAQEIQSRGVGGDYGRRDLNQLRQQGAGPETMAALTRLLPLAILTLRTEPGATVKLDGGAPTLAGADGLTTLSNIDPGRHEITVDKQYFTRASRVVELKGREATSIDLKLEWAVGFLSVSADVPDAQIRIPGAPPQTGRVTRVALPIGQTSVSATAHLRKSASQTVTIEAGKETTISLSLPIDEAAINAMATQIHDAFRSRSYPVVIQQAGQYLQTGAQDKDVLADLALSYLEMSNYPAFQDAAGRALSSGATLRFEVKHHHLSMGGFGGGSLHNAELTVSAESLGYKPLDRCNLPEFRIPIKDVRLGKRETAVLDRARSVPVIDLNVPEPNNPKKQVNVNISAGRTPQGITAGKARNSLLFREDRGKVDTIRQLLHSLAQ